MKTSYLKSLIVVILSILLTGCNTKKSQNVVIIQSVDKMFAVGEAPVEIKSYGAIVNYFSPGAIVICKVDYNILNQHVQSGTVYRITRDLQLDKIESIDTAIANKDIAQKYYYTKGLINDEIELEEIDLKTSD